MGDVVMDGSFPTLMVLGGAVGLAAAFVVDWGAWWAGGVSVLVGAAIGGVFDMWRLSRG